MKGECLMLACLMLSACSPAQPTTSAPPATSVPSPTGLPSPTPADLPTTTGCLWNWGTRPLPEVTDRLQAALDVAGIEGATASAAAFGEDCIDPQSGQVKGFATLETDFYFTVPVTDTADLWSLGELAEKALLLLDGFPPGSTPGPQPGSVAIAFVGGRERRNLWFKLTQWTEARRRGLRGEALLEALSSGPG